jgi:hypothetical protein
MPLFTLQSLRPLYVRRAETLIDVVEKVIVRVEASADHAGRPGRPSLRRRRALIRVPDPGSLPLWGVSFVFKDNIGDGEPRDIRSLQLRFVTPVRERAAKKAICCQTQNVTVRRRPQGLAIAAEVRARRAAAFPVGSRSDRRGCRHRRR